MRECDRALSGVNAGPIFVQFLDCVYQVSVYGWL
jgi:hypothetical protein